MLLHSFGVRYRSTPPQFPASLEATSLDDLAPRRARIHLQRLLFRLRLLHWRFRRLPAHANILPVLAEAVTHDGNLVELNLADLDRILAEVFSFLEAEFFEEALRDVLVRRSVLVLENLGGGRKGQDCREGRNCDESLHCATPLPVKRSNYAYYIISYSFVKSK